jgi:hypothetical protein
MKVARAAAWSAHRGRHQPWGSLHAPEEEFYLLPRQDDGQPFRPFGTHDALEEADLFVQNLTVKKQEGIQRLMLWPGRP